MIIRVTQEHIDRGIQRDCSECPVALALLDAGFRDPKANASTLRNGKKFICRTPDKVYDFMSHFDSVYYGDDNPTPFEFEIPDAA